MRVRERESARERERASERERERERDGALERPVRLGLPLAECDDLLELRRGGGGELDGINIYDSLIA